MENLRNSQMLQLSQSELLETEPEEEFILSKIVGSRVTTILKIYLIKDIFQDIFNCIFLEF